MNFNSEPVDNATGFDPFRAILDNCPRRVVRKHIPCIEMLPAFSPCLAGSCISAYSALDPTMDRRKLLEMAGFGVVATLPQIYPEGFAAAMARADENAESGELPGSFGQVVPSRMEYLVVDDADQRGSKISQLLTFLAADRGYEVIAVTGPDQNNGTREYLLARRRPLEPSA